MTIYQLRLAIFGRMCAWGIGAGAVCGAVYGTILVPIFGTITGAVVGSALGLVLGVINGAFLSNITAHHYYPLLNFKVYQRTTSVLSAVISGIGVAFLMWVAAFGGRGQSTEMQVVASLAICVIVPAFIAGLTAVIATRRVTGWYKMNADRVQSAPRPRDEMNGLRSMSRKFQRRTENFVCENCGESVTGNGYTNHCPVCLWSKHVDVNPGDRAADCGGLMEPVGAEQKSGETIIVHRCVKCHYVKRNRAAEEDDFDLLVELLAMGNIF